MCGVKSRTYSRYVALSVDGIAKVTFHYTQCEYHHTRGGASHVANGTVDMGPMLEELFWRGPDCPAAVVSPLLARSQSQKETVAPETQPG